MAQPEEREIRFADLSEEVVQGFVEGIREALSGALGDLVEGRGSPDERRLWRPLRSAGAQYASLVALSVATQKAEEVVRANNRLAAYGDLWDHAGVVGQMKAMRDLATEALVMVAVACLGLGAVAKTAELSDGICLASDNATTFKDR